MTQDPDPTTQPEPEPAPELAPSPDPSAPRRCRIAALEAWFVEHVHGSAIAERTDLYNRVHHAKEALRRILGEIEEMI